MPVVEISHLDSITTEWRLDPPWGPTAGDVFLNGAFRLGSDPVPNHGGLLELQLKTPVTFKIRKSLSAQQRGQVFRNTPRNGFERSRVWRAMRSNHSNEKARDGVELGLRGWVAGGRKN